MRSSVALALLAAGAAYAANPYPDRLRLRVEGLTATLFEGYIRHPGPGRDITTDSGGTHLCDGTNDGAHPDPSATGTTILDDAGLYFDGTYESNFQDFFITKIGPDAQTSTQFWGILQNLQFTPTGGCTTQALAGSHTLWAFDAFNKNHFLKLSPGRSQATAGQPFDVIVTDENGNPLSGAEVKSFDPATGLPVPGGVTATSDDNGVAMITETSAGDKVYKAYRDDSIRSRRIRVHVRRAPAS